MRCWEINNETAIQKLNHEVGQEPTNTSLINRLAIAYLENNQYELALEQFQEAVRIKPTVQALNNLAWMYANEGEPNPDGSWTERPDKAIPLLEQAVHRDPQSDFPYSLLGEMYWRFTQYDSAIRVLKQSIQIRESMRALNNMGVALYHQGSYHTAADFFLRATNLDSEVASWNRMMSLVQAKEYDTAQEEMKSWSTVVMADPTIDYGGPLLLAQLFMALRDFKRAVEHYKLAFGTSWIDHEWVSEYLYALHQLGRQDEINSVFQTFVDEINERIEQAEDDQWESKDEKQEYLREQENEIIELIRCKDELQSSFVPQIKFEPILEYGCYLFGCSRHGHEEYNSDEQGT